MSDERAPLIVIVTPYYQDMVLYRQKHHLNPRHCIHVWEDRYEAILGLTGEGVRIVLLALPPYSGYLHAHLKLLEAKGATVEW